MRSLAWKLASIFILLIASVFVSRVQLALVDAELPSDKAVVYFVPQEVHAYAGEQIAVSLVIFNVTGLYGFDVEFSWNTTILKYVSHTVTTPVESYSTPQDPSPYAGILHTPIFQLMDVIDEDGGIPGANPETKAWFSYSSRNPAPVFNGNGTVFTMILNVTNPGTCDLKLPSVKLSDKNGNPIPYYKIEGLFSTPEKPLADFTFSPAEPHINETIVFNATLSRANGGVITGYEWDFGDGNTTTVSNPIIAHAYPNAVTYNVTLTITDSESLTDVVWALVAVSDIHDVAVLGVSASTPETYVSHLVNVTVIVKNKGTATENFDVTAYYDTSPIETQHVTNLTPNTEKTLTFTWNTTGVPPGLYLISADVSVVLGETEVMDNYLTDGTVNVRLLPDIAILNVVLSKTVVGQGYSVRINVTVENQGDATETFTLTLYCNSNILKTLPLTLRGGTSTTLNFTWDTTSFAKGNYTISAYVPQIPDEEDTADNSLAADREVCVTILGDVDGDFDVDLYDAVKLLIRYGSQRGDPTYDPNLDIDDDGKIFLYDAVILLNRYGQKDP